MEEVGSSVVCKQSRGDVSSGKSSGATIRKANILCTSEWNKAGWNELHAVEFALHRIGFISSSSESLSKGFTHRCC